MQGVRQWLKEHSRPPDDCKGEDGERPVDDSTKRGCGPYRPDKALSGEADPVMNALLGQLAKMSQLQCPSGQARSAWKHVLFSLMPSEPHMFLLWSSMDRPSKAMTKKWIRACFLVGAVDALHRGWFPLFECPQTLPVGADGGTVICTPFEFCLKALDSATDATAGAGEHVRRRTNVPLTISDDDDDMDVESSCAPQQANMRSVLRKMIGDGIGNSPPLNAVSAQIRDVYGDGDLYACLGPLLRGASRTVAGQALLDFNTNGSPPCRLVGNIDLRTLPDELDAVLRAFLCSVGVPGMDEADPVSDASPGPANIAKRKEPARMAASRASKMSTAGLPKSAASHKENESGESHDDGRHTPPSADSGSGGDSETTPGKSRRARGKEAKCKKAKREPKKEARRRVYPTDSEVTDLTGDRPPPPNPQRERSTRSAAAIRAQAQEWPGHGDAVSTPHQGVGPCTLFFQGAPLRCMIHARPGLAASLPDARVPVPWQAHTAPASCLLADSQKSRSMTQTGTS